MAYRSQMDLLKEGGKIVEELRDETGETVQLSVLEDNVMLVLVKEESSKPIRIISRVGSRVPVNWAAAGRLLISDLPGPELRGLLQRIAKPSPTGRAPTDPDELVRQIRRFRTQGFGFELNEATSMPAASRRRSPICRGNASLRSASSPRNSGCSASTAKS